MRNLSMRLLALLPYVSLALSSPDVPVDTEAIISTVVFQSTQYSAATLTTYSLTTKTLDDLETTTIEVSGTTTTVTTREATATTIKSVDSTITTTVEQVVPVTLLSTIGSTTIYSADPTSTGSDSTAAASSTISSTSASAAASSSTSLATKQVTSSTSSNTSTKTAPSLPSSAASIPATTPTSLPAANPTNNADNDLSSKSGGGLSAGAKAAIGTATVIVCALLLLTVFCLGHRWQTRRHRSEDLDDEHLVNPDAAPYGFDGADPTPSAATAVHDQAVRDLRGMEMRKLSDVSGSVDQNGKRRISQIPELDAEPVHQVAGTNRGALGYNSPTNGGSMRTNVVSEMPGSTRFGRDGQLLK